MTATPRMRQMKKPANVQPSDKLLKFMEDECKPVKGVFKNYECPGGSVTVHMDKYPGQPPFSQTLFDGMEYEVPLWVARWLNGIDVTAKNINGRINSCSYPRHEYQYPDKNGNMNQSPTPIPVLGQTKQRYGFQSMDFML